MTSLGESIRYRWRTVLGAAVGVAAGVSASRFGAPVGAATLLGWVSGSVVFLVPTAMMLLGDSEATVRRRAGREDENRAVLLGVMLAVVAASLWAIVIALHQAKSDKGQGGHIYLLGLCVATLVTGWLVVQSLFTLHYAHRYFGDRDNDGTADEGLNFPGAAPTTYRDFLYVAICIGATCQVSDFDVTSHRFRNLVTAHAVVAFFFNTMVLALGINIIGNLMGQ